MLIGALAQYFFGFTIFVLSTFLVLLVLVQRGRGGGLTGALGGPGGQSAFGTKAGDLFTRITIGVATAWIVLCASAVFMLRGRALPETGGIDRPVVKSELGAGSGTTGAEENTSALPKIDLPSVNLPNSDSPEVKPADPIAPGAGASPPTAAETTSTPTTDPAALAEPPATDPTPPAANVTPDPTAPK